MPRVDAALAVAEACRGPQPIADIVKAYCDTALEFGFTCAANGAWYHAGGTRLNRFFFNTWPQDWFEVYQRENLGPADPVVTDAARSMDAFSFTERRQDWQSHLGGARVVAIAEAYGWSEVFVVPIHGPCGYQGAVSLASLDKPALSGIDRAALEAMSRAIHMRCRTERGYGIGLAERADLTDRQIECLRWVAAGKSDTDIAALLGISAPTVHFHIEQAKKRLAVHSRMQAVGRLLLDGTL